MKREGKCDDHRKRYMEQGTRPFKPSNGWLMLAVFILLLIGDIALFIYCANQGSKGIRMFCCLSSRSS